MFNNQRIQSLVVPVKCVAVGFYNIILTIYSQRAFCCALFFHIPHLKSEGSFDLLPETFESIDNYHKLLNMEIFTLISLSLTCLYQLLQWNIC